MSASSRVCIGKIPVDRVSLDDVLRLVSDALTSRTPKTFFYANAHAITLAEGDPEFTRAMERADAVFCDGFGVYLASRVLGASLPQRFTPPDWIDRLGTACGSLGVSMFFLGAREGVAEEAARRVKGRVHGLEVYAHHGHFPKDSDSSRRVIEFVNKTGASVLLVGFGMPLQEEWIMAHRAELTPILVISVGGMFDLVAEALPRGPRWLTDHGLEWLTRLMIEPRRLWRRYLLGLPEFAFLIARQKLSGRPALPAKSR